MLECYVDTQYVLFRRREIMTIMANRIKERKGRRKRAALNFESKEYKRMEHSPRVD
jgi:hypothetical protein